MRNNITKVIRHCILNNLNNVYKNIIKNINHYNYDTCLVNKAIIMFAMEKIKSLCQVKKDNTILRCRPNATLTNVPKHFLSINKKIIRQPDEGPNT